jgi:TolB-like protein
MNVLHGRLRFVVAAAAIACSAGCATGSVAARTHAIADADAGAKRALANEQQIDAARIPARSIAILPFDTPASDTLLGPLSYALSDLLLTDLATSPQLMFVERTNMDAMLRELALAESGASDPRTAPRVGRLIGARRLLIGSVFRVGQDQLTIQARVVDVIAGTVAELVTATAPLSRAIDAEDALALRIFEELGIVLTPAQRARVQAQATTQLATLVAYGRGLQLEGRGDAAGATRYFSEAARLDPRFVSQRYQANASRAGSTAGGVQRALALGVQGVNTLGSVRVSDAADAPLVSSSLLTLVLTIHITP